MNYQTDRIEFADATVGGSSMVGIIGKPPVSFGNYCDLLNGPRVLNMWAENLEYAKDHFLEDGLVRIKNYGKYCIILDERIPNEFYYNKCCFTGAGYVSVEDAKDIYSILGDETEQLLQFTDPDEYHRRRGEVRIVFDDGYTMISSEITNKSRKLKGKWTFEITNNTISTNESE